MSDQIATDFPRFYRTVQPELGYEGFIVIDSLLSGRSAGGIRMTPDVSQEEVAALARVMTTKFGFANVSFGGAKAGIRLTAPLTPQGRRAVMESFGREFSEVIASGLYRPAEDIGTNPDDVSVVLEAAGRPARDTSRASSGRYTALTVVAAAEVLCQQARISVRGASLAIEGFGKVGSEAARLLVERGARLVAVSTMEGAVWQPRGLDVGRLQELRDRHGDACMLHYRGGEPTTIEQLIALDVDLLILAGKPYAIHAGNVDHVRASVIVPGGNLSIVRDAEETLVKRGRIILPDFVVNCGGVLGLLWNWMGVSDDRIRRLVDGEFAKKVEYLIAASTGTRSVRHLAENVAAQNMLRMGREVDPGRPRGLAQMGARLREVSPSWVASKLLRLVSSKRGPGASTMAAYAKARFWADRPLYRGLSQPTTTPEIP